MGFENRSKAIVGVLIADQGNAAIAGSGKLLIGRDLDGGFRDGLRRRVTRDDLEEPGDRLGHRRQHIGESDHRAAHRLGRGLGIGLGVPQALADDDELAPPRRPTVSLSRTTACSRVATSVSSRSPTAWPWWSFRSLK